jgi:stage II sporulation protein E
MQELLFGQMEISTELMYEAGRKVAETTEYDLELIKTVSGILTSAGFKFNALTAYYNSSARLFIEIYISEREFKSNADEICALLSEELNRDLEYYDAVYAEGNVRLVFSENAGYQLQYHVFQSTGNAGSKDVTGDNYDVFYDGNGYAYVALSDGMGTGSRASLESKMLLNHFKRLMKSGIEDVNLAIRMINYIMQVKSTEEIFATLDLAKVDLDSGEATLYKYGASATLIKQGNVLKQAHTVSFPVGIIEDNEKPYEERVTLSSGDLLIMLSDGVTDYSYIKRLLNSNPTDYDQLARRIGRQAKEKSRDDITVIIAEVV